MTWGRQSTWQKPRTSRTVSTVLPRFSLPGSAKGVKRHAWRKSGCVFLPEIRMLYGNALEEAAARVIAVHAACRCASQFNYTTNNGAITITGYTGSGGTAIIPDMINGLPVTCIGNNAFYTCTSLTNVTIGTNVTTIGDRKSV